MASYASQRSKGRQRNGGSRGSSDEACRKRLAKLLKLPENKFCADCGVKGARWASINLGIFVCIKCSGIHRNLGVHLSKVKSVSLDKWNPEMVDFMEEWGNKRARE